MVAEARNRNCSLTRFAYMPNASCPKSFYASEKSYFLVFLLTSGEVIIFRKKAQLCGVN